MIVETDVEIAIVEYAKRKKQNARAEKKRQEEEKHKERVRRSIEERFAMCYYLGFFCESCSICNTLDGKIAMKSILEDIATSPVNDFKLLWNCLMKKRSDNPLGGENLLELLGLEKLSST
jgi:hypothetical protein